MCIGPAAVHAVQCSGMSVLLSPLTGNAPSSTGIISLSSSPSPSSSSLSIDRNDRYRYRCEKAEESQQLTEHITHLAYTVLYPYEILRTYNTVCTSNQGYFFISHHFFSRKSSLTGKKNVYPRLGSGLSAAAYRTSQFVSYRLDTQRPEMIHFISTAVR